MTAFDLYPKFTNREEYLSWKKAWAKTYKSLSDDVKKRKSDAKNAQREGVSGEHQKNLIHAQSVCYKMMGLINEAKERRDRILKMRHDISNQGFPLDLGICKNVDFHYNKVHSEYDFMPMWTLRVKGRSYYVNEIESFAPWTTRERASGSTKGVLRFPKCRIAISKDGVANILIDETTKSS